MLSDNTAMILPARGGCPKFDPIKPANHWKASNKSGSNTCTVLLFLQLLQPLSLSQASLRAWHKRVNTVTCQRRNRAAITMSIQLLQQLQASQPW